MAEILIKAMDHNHKDPSKGVRGAYKRGDPVVAMPDGHEWGSGERLPDFVVVQIPGLPPDVARKLYTQPQLSPILDQNGRQIVARRRERSFDLNAASVRENGVVLLSQNGFEALLSVKGEAD